MIFLTVFNIAIGICAVLLLMGKCDWLIAGYNTADEEQRQHYDIRRLRILVAATLILCCPITEYPVFIGRTHDKSLILPVLAASFALCLITIILANTWCKKK